MKELALREVTEAFEPAVNNLVSSFIHIVENNNSTKIALQKIDADMKRAISEIQKKGDGIENTIQACSDMMKNVLNNSSLTFEQQAAFVDKFTTAMLNALDKY